MADLAFSEAQRLVDSVGGPLEQQLLLSCTLPSRRPLVSQAYSWAIADDEALFDRLAGDRVTKQLFLEKLMRRLTQLLIEHVQTVGVSG